jgi:hypothetical protein
MPPREKDIASKRSEKPGWIEWFGSRARAILLEDLEPDGVLHGQDHLSADDLFGFYKRLPEFEMVVFSQFEERLKANRQTTGMVRRMAQRDTKAMEQDRKVVPRSPSNNRGELVFDMTPAKGLLRGDVELGIHEQMGPTQLQNTRPEYKLFSQAIFKGRVYQEVRRQKWIHFLDVKRAQDRPFPPRSREQFREEFGVQFTADRAGGGSNFGFNPTIE